MVVSVGILICSISLCIILKLLFKPHLHLILMTFTSLTDVTSAVSGGPDAIKCFQLVHLGFLQINEEDMFLPVLMALYNSIFIFL